ncbi:TetR family transcriptional regulator [Rhodococcus gannanensis]|uniref:TetR family transcriptional regulator n=1 Tax=Rhodococcus gannanensis TaxID=1960308 RepID=A0ABW4NX56_9NOCA
MARQQERARRTRAAIVEAAAVEFARRGYAAASVNTILEGSHATKGAMYFHFESKEDLARAVLAAALEKYTEAMDRWKRVDADPFQVLHSIVVEMADRFVSDVIVQAEFRLIVEPEFYPDVRSGGTQVWGRTAFDLLARAEREGLLRPGADVAVFGRVLAATLAGHAHMIDLTALTTGSTGLRERYEEGLEVLLTAMASESWLETWRRDGWQDLTPLALAAAEEIAAEKAEDEAKTSDDQSI